MRNSASLIALGAGLLLSSAGIANAQNTPATPPTKAPTAPSSGGSAPAATAEAPRGMASGTASAAEAGTAAGAATAEKTAQAVTSAPGMETPAASNTPAPPATAAQTFPATAPAVSSPAPAASSTTAPHASMIDTSGKQIGTAVFTQTPHGVLVTVDATGLPPGEHGFHLHQVGTCDAAGGFTSAGGHFAPGNKSHGFEVAAGPHAGDMPNQFVGADGKLHAEVFNPNVTLKAGANSLMDADGSALIIHTKADDYKSQPTGEAGGRLACAALSPKK